MPLILTRSTPPMAASAWTHFDHFGSYHLHSIENQTPTAYRRHLPSALSGNAPLSLGCTNARRTEFWGSRSYLTVDRRCMAFGGDIRMPRAEERLRRRRFVLRPPIDAPIRRHLAVYRPHMTAV